MTAQWPTLLLVGFGLLMVVGVVALLILKKGGG